MAVHALKDVREVCHTRAGGEGIEECDMSQQREYLRNCINNLGFSNNLFCCFASLCDQPISNNIFDS